MTSVTVRKLLACVMMTAPNTTGDSTEHSPRLRVSILNTSTHLLAKHGCNTHNEAPNRVCRIASMSGSLLGDELTRGGAQTNAALRRRSASSWTEPQTDLRAPHSTRCQTHW